ncbi:AhpA/YtjB family protein [Aestuariibacter sp. AA17]|uniref:AhpA/YtjB family protein n=1 Tax=Fluctibacter corallii TaxID=2984329 RepID=A0ABT3A3I1_9ALTE|nr:AhpA/YtjB family protein [Aestuariibacter sp. AA17]MCV2883240.1 AhpA/YtjB family protein [Aestuariibacter sp. AA17]
MQFTYCSHMNLVKRNTSVDTFEANRTFALATNDKQHSNYSIYKRLANLVLAVFTSVICINLWLLSQDTAQNWHDRQAGQLGRSLVQLSAQTLASDVANIEQDKIQGTLSYLIADHHVISATVHDAKGKVIATTHPALSMTKQLADSTKLPLVFIEEIIYDSNIVGYLRIQIDESTIMEYHDEYQRQLYEQVLVLMMLAGAMGILGARAFYKFRYRHIKMRAKKRPKHHLHQTAQQSLKL